MKRAMIWLMLVVVSGMAYGQKPGHHRGDGDPIEKMSEVITLTDAQKESITAINAEYKEKIQTAMKSGDRELGDSLKNEKREKISALLTDEQKAQLAEHRKEMRDEHKGKREEMRKAMHEKMEPVMRAKRAEFDSELSADEKATIARVREEVKSHMGDSMPADHHGPPAWVNEAKTQLQPIIDNHKTSLDTIMADLRTAHKEAMKAQMGDKKGMHQKQDKMHKMHDQKMKGDHPKGDHPQGMGMKDGMLVRFLLMDPNVAKE